MNEDQQRAYELVTVNRGYPARRPGTYSCGCPLRLVGWDCPKMSCPNKYAWHGGKDPLHSELYAADAAW